MDREIRFSDACTANAIVCTKGSLGPLCGFCQANFYVDLATGRCAQCNTKFASNIPIFLLSAMLIAALLAVRRPFSFLKRIRKRLSLGSDAKQVFVVRARRLDARPDRDTPEFIDQIRHSCEAHRSRLRCALPTVSSGAFKIIWTTAQVLSCIDVSLNVSFPAPFSTFLGILLFTRLDFQSVRVFFFRFKYFEQAGV